MILVPTFLEVRSQICQACVSGEPLCQVSMTLPFSSVSCLHTVSVPFLFHSAATVTTLVADGVPRALASGRPVSGSRTISPYSLSVAGRTR